MYSGISVFQVFVSAHKRVKHTEDYNAHTSRANWGSKILSPPFFFFWGMVLAPGQRICHLFVLQSVRSRDWAWTEGHLLVFLQSQDQLLSFHHHRELQRHRVTLKRQHKWEVMCELAWNLITKDAEWKTKPSFIFCIKFFFFQGKPIFKVTYKISVFS